jgi:glutamate dehydrogenase/leucine dehydrogenase
MGNVSLYMMGDLLERRVGKIVGADLSPDALEQVRQRYPTAPLDLRAVERGDDSILGESCDVLAPNATGAVLDSTSIPTVAAKVVCGAANNQLAETGRDARALQERGVLYVPDFLANRMGIVNCANEQYGVIPEDPSVNAHLDREVPHGIFRRTLEIIERAKQRGSTPAEEAEVLADELSQELHPLWGNRGQVIIDALVRTGWAEERR